MTNCHSVPTFDTDIHVWRWRVDSSTYIFHHISNNSQYLFMIMWQRLHPQSSLTTSVKALSMRVDPPVLSLVAMPNMALSQGPAFSIHWSCRAGERVRVDASWDKNHTFGVSSSEVFVKNYNQRYAESSRVFVLRRSDAPLHPCLGNGREMQRKHA